MAGARDAGKTFHIHSPHNRGLSKPNVTSAEVGRPGLEAPINALPTSTRQTSPFFWKPSPSVSSIYFGSSAPAGLSTIKQAPVCDQCTQPLDKPVLGAQRCPPKPGASRPSRVYEGGGTQSARGPTEQRPAVPRPVPSVRLQPTSRRGRREGPLGWAGSPGRGRGQRAGVSDPAPPLCTRCRLTGVAETQLYAGAPSRGRGARAPGPGQSCRGTSLSWRVS